MAYCFLILVLINFLTLLMLFCEGAIELGNIQNLLTFR